MWHGVTCAAWDFDWGDRSMGELRGGEMGWVRGHGWRCICGGINAFVISWHPGFLVFWVLAEGLALVCWNGLI